MTLLPPSNDGHLFDHETLRISPSGDENVRLSRHVQRFAEAFGFFLIDGAEERPRWLTTRAMGCTEHPFERVIFRKIAVERGRPD
jgi:hypothetical protein